MEVFESFLHQLLLNLSLQTLSFIEIERLLPDAGELENRNFSYFFSIFNKSIHSSSMLYFSFQCFSIVFIMISTSNRTRDNSEFFIPLLCFALKDFFFVTSFLYSFGKFKNKNFLFWSDLIVSDNHDRNKWDIFFRIFYRSVSLHDSYIVHMFRFPCTQSIDFFIDVRWCISVIVSPTFFNQNIGKNSINE